MPHTHLRVAHYEALPPSTFQKNSLPIDKCVEHSPPACQAEESVKAKSKIKKPRAITHLLLVGGTSVARDNAIFQKHGADPGIQKFTCAAVNSFHFAAYTWHGEHRSW